MQGGTPDITIAQWAILGRCRAAGWVTHDALLACANEWFEPALSEAELTAVLDSLHERQWIEIDPVHRIARATLAGSLVVDRFERPVGFAEGWNAFHPMRTAQPGEGGTACDAAASSSSPRSAL